MRTGDPGNPPRRTCRTLGGRDVPAIDRPRPWTPAEDAILRAACPPRWGGLRAVAARLGRSRRAVKCRAAALGVAGKPFAWEPGFDDVVRRMHAAGARDREIAARLGCSFVPVAAARRRLGLPALKARVDPASRERAANTRWDRFAADNAAENRRYGLPADISPLERLALVELLDRPRTAGELGYVAKALRRRRLICPVGRRDRRRPGPGCTPLLYTLTGRALAMLSNATPVSSCPVGTSLDPSPGTSSR